MSKFSLLANRRAVSERRRRQYPKLWPLLIYLQMGVIAVTVELVSFLICKFWLFRELSRFPFDFWIFHYEPWDGGLGSFLAFVVSFAVSSLVSFVLQRKRTFRANNSTGKSAVMYIVLVLASYLFTLWIPPYILPFFLKLFGPGLGDTVNRLAVSGLTAMLQFPINKFLIMRNKKIVYEAAIFDLDGTLLDSLQDLADAGNYTLSQLGFAPHAVDKYKYFVGSGIPNLVRRMLPETARPDTYVTALRIFSDYYAKHKADHTAPYPGILRLLRRMARYGVPVAVVSNKDDAPAKALVRDYFGPYVAVIKGRTDEYAIKPDPGLVFAALNELGADPARTLYIGDSNVDMETAKNAGLDSCGVLWGFRTEAELSAAGAKYLVENVHELGRKFGITLPNGPKN